ncbi:response regulator transcription factor [Candidatus Woesebacteria bacterium]|nr:response regulator transcription factor [Candidatus Woesebacteria bacterium]
MSVVPTIVVVEDEPSLLEYLQDILVNQRFTVHPVNKGTQALTLIEQVNPNLVLLDLSLPDISGETVCAEVKKLFPRMPIIILTAKDDTKDIVAGLGLGADDYITKPFKTEELLARIQARLRDPSSDPVLRMGDLEMNTETFEVKRADKTIPLTQTEYTLLHYLLTNKNRVLTRDMILSSVWSYTPDVESRVVDVYIGYLRKKIDKGHTDKLIHSMRGFGYSLRDDSAKNS